MQTTSSPSPCPQYGPGVPHPARVYSYWLGDKDHCSADREAAEEVMRLRPEVVAGARANRAFGRRVARYAAYGCGIRQFLDIGAGMPAPDATHETVQRISSACRVAYVDSDPLVLTRARAMLTAATGSKGACVYIEADVRDPAALLTKAAATLDFSQPTAVLLLAVLHFVPDVDDPAGIVADLAGALAPGSMIAISHLTADYAPGPVTDGAAAYNARVPAALFPRTRKQVAGLLGKLPADWPGVVPVTRWRPSFEEAPGRPVDMLAAVSRLPAAGDHYRRKDGMDLAAAQHVPGRRLDDDDPDPDELALIASGFPGYRIWRATASDRIRYTAQGVGLTARPHTVVTASLAELRAELTAGQPTAAP